MNPIKTEINKLQKQIVFFTGIAWILVIVGIVVLFFGLWEYYNKPKMSLNELGDFLAGSMTGLWSLAGLFFIYVAFLGQKQQMIYQQEQLEINNKDLELNRQEIKQTNQTLQLQSKEMAQQNETAKKQQFENLFFNMIDTYLKIVSDLDINVNDFDAVLRDKLQGRDIFMFLFKNKIKEIPDGSKRIVAYGELYDKYNAEFGHYYRFLYRIIDLIDNQVFFEKYEFDPDDNPNRDFVLYNFEIKYEYTSIVRSLLSDEELQLLFLNMLHFKDLKFKTLIENYCFLKNIPNGEEKIKNEDYVFHPGAIDKTKNSNVKELDFLKQQQNLNTPS